MLILAFCGIVFFFDYIHSPKYKLPTVLFVVTTSYQIVAMDLDTVTGLSKKNVLRRNFTVVHA